MAFLVLKLVAFKIDLGCGTEHLGEDHLLDFSLDFVATPEAWFW
jgi:hypothetical protein